MGAGWWIKWLLESCPAPSLCDSSIKTPSPQAPAPYTVCSIHSSLDSLLFVSFSECVYVCPFPIKAVSSSRTELFTLLLVPTPNGFSVDELNCLPLSGPKLWFLGALWWGWGTHCGSSILSVCFFDLGLDCFSEAPLVVELPRSLRW